MTAPRRSLSEKGVSLCLCENLRVSVVKLLKKTLTTEAQRSHRGTEINSDRLEGVPDVRSTKDLYSEGSGTPPGCGPINIVFPVVSADSDHRLLSLQPFGLLT